MSKPYTRKRIIHKTDSDGIYDYLDDNLNKYQYDPYNYKLKSDYLYAEHDVQIEFRQKQERSRGF